MYILIVGVVCRVLIFFFSSRRRHTRCLSDWSSDVCSSDLRRAAPARADAGCAEQRRRREQRVPRASVAELPHDDRSEERRVGKEGRKQWTKEQAKQTKKTLRCH